jgi:orotidine-5'-phosphate decarboxylase
MKNVAAVGHDKRKRAMLLRAPKGNPKLIVALDVSTLKQARALVDILYPEVKIFKIGSQLFTQKGPEAVRMVREKGAQVFLDLKFHDIPNTVACAVKSSKAHGVLMLNVHASGGAEMMKAAVSARGKSSLPLLLAVTMLTSMDKRELNNIGISRAPLAQVKKLALLAKRCGMDGVVCSGHEISLVRKACGRNFIILTPGIRPFGGSVQDQKRTMTPEAAARKGADYIVVGRPVIHAQHPLEVVKTINSVFQSGPVERRY